MNLNIRINIVMIILLSGLLVSCKNDNPRENNDTEALKFQNKAHELVDGMVRKVGDYRKLASKNDVTYTYTYTTPDGKTDISVEKYIFDGEYSYGIYSKHERTLPQLEGIIEQGFDGNEYWLKQNGEIISDESLLKRVAFNRPTNFYWFTMMQKLVDPGLNYEYLGEKTLDRQDYDIVRVTFNSERNEPTDIYQLYINKKSLLIDQFLFTVADFGKMETPNLMTLKYEEIEGVLIPTIRQYKQSTWDADVTDDPWIMVTWTGIKFNTGITKEAFKKGN